MMAEWTKLTLIAGLFTIKIRSGKFNGSMQYDIDKFYLDIVSPFVREFENDRSSLRRAYGATWALDSFASHMFYFFKSKGNLSQKGDIDFKREVLCQDSTDFKMILDVSAATKHAVRSNPNNTSVYAVRTYAR